jgi:hypothetical protein
MTPRGPNLSHWPGNRTPPKWKADLSTQICLAFARAPQGEQEAFLDGAEVVLNDHYDTDGFLSLLAVLRRELAQDREELIVLAAATGDFQAFQTPRSFAVDRIVLNLADPERTPLGAQFQDLGDGEKALARYRWLLEHAEQVLGEPESLAALYEDELALVQGQLEACGKGALQRTFHPPCGLAVLRSDRPLVRMVLNTLAGAYRVLQILQGPEGMCYRYHDRTESWFELVTLSPLPRRDLRPLARQLEEMEGDRGGGGWFADPPTEPVPEVYFGNASAQEYGKITRELLPSRLDPEEVERAFVDFFLEPETRSNL